MNERTKTRGPDRLRAYKLARSLADQIDALVRQAECSPVHGAQLRGAAESLVLNIAEGSARFGRRRLHHYRTARGDALQCAVQLTSLRTWNPRLNIFRARATAEIIASMLAGLLTEAVARASDSRQQPEP